MKKLQGYILKLWELNSLFYLKTNQVIVKFLFRALIKMMSINIEIKCFAMFFLVKTSNFYNIKTYINLYILHNF